MPVNDPSADPDAKPAVPNRRAKRVFLKLLRLSVTIYVGFCCAIYFLQGSIVFPAAKYQGTAQAIIRPERDSELIHLTTRDGDQVAAMFGPALLDNGSIDPEAAHRPTIIYFYGNGGAVAWSFGEFDHFRRLRANVLVPDYVGFGMSSGKPSEEKLYATADAAYDYVTHRPGIDSRKIIPVGWSLGGAVAIDLASRRQVAGLATFNAFTSMREMARQTMPWIPTTLLCKYDFANEKKISRISVPVFICNGMRDTLVPPVMSDRLARAAKGPVARVTIDSADHHTIFIAKPLDLFNAMRKFVNEVDGPPAP